MQESTSGGKLWKMAESRLSSLRELESGMLGRHALSLLNLFIRTIKETTADRDLGLCSLSSSRFGDGGASGSGWKK